MSQNFIIAAAGLAAIALPAFAHAQVNQSQVNQRGYSYSVPFDLANAAAQEALRTCTANGYPVTVTLVDVSGVPQIVLRGDHSTIHTRDSSFRKAYTVVTVGPLFKQETSGAFAELVQKNPAAAQLATLPNMIALPGAVAIMANGQIVGGLGVAGSPGGDKDEACAQAGVAKIKNQLPQ